MHSLLDLNSSKKNLPFFGLVTFVIGSPFFSLASIDTKAVFNNSLIWSSVKSWGKLTTYNSKSFLQMSEGDTGISFNLSRPISSKLGLPKYLYGLDEIGE